MKNILVLLSTFLVFSTCNNRSAIENIEQIPEVQEADQAFANVFKKLDGTWRGQFNIYEHQQRVAADKMELAELTAQSVIRPGMVLTSSIQVQQTYTSESPFFQRVSIVDFYPKTMEEMVSRGVNKVQDGKLWCVVKKPNELIVHEGSTRGDDTIIWQSDTKEKKEYFYETVTEDSYEIIGWGYYGEDDRSMSPKLWFYGNYRRMK